MPNSFVTAFRQQFPKGSILSEVLTIHNELFVVRVSVWAEGNLLSQALAANNTLELAEDIACNRALERLSLTDQSGAVASIPTLSTITANIPSTEAQSAEVSSPMPTVAVASGFGEPTHGDDTPVKPTVTPEENLAALARQPSPSQPVPEVARVGLPQTPPSDRGSAPESSIEAIPHPVLKLATPPAAKDPQTEDQPQDPGQSDWEPEAGPGLGDVATDPIDLSDIIAQTDVELQRLGWGVNQGREFLEKTYGKRSRHDLTDEELLEFLLYLESQPRPSA